MKKIPSGVLLVVVMIATALTACSGKKTGTPASSAVQVSADSPSWSQDKTPYTLTWFVAYDWYGKSFNPALNLGDKQLLEETGITLEISVGNTEKLNMLIATDGLPDMVTFDAVASQRKLLESGGVVLDLEELAAKYAPDLNVPQSMKNWYRGDDGKWYAIASYYYGPERTNEAFGGYYVTHNLNYARQDILDQIGLSLDSMKTKNGFLNALRLVRDKKISYRGKPILPYIGGTPEGLAAQFGADLEDPSGSLVNIRRTPEYSEALLFLNTCYNEGLISDEQFTINSTQRDQKVAAGEVFAMSWWRTAEDTRKSLFSLDPNAKIMYIGPINGGDSGKTPLLEGVACGGWTGTMITKNCKNPAKAIQFMSYMTSEKETMNNYWGYTAYDVVNGKAFQKDAVKNEFSANYEAAYAKYNMNINYFVDWTIVEKYTPRDDTALYYTIDHYDQEHDRSVTIYDNKAFLFVDPEDGTDLAVAKIKIDDYWTQQIPKMVMARTGDECVRIYKESIAQIESMGFKNLEAYQNDQFKKNKQKLGVQRLWPR